LVSKMPLSWVMASVLSGCGAWSAGHRTKCPHIIAI
jgi:hypothetical protein